MDAESCAREPSLSSLLGCTTVALLSAAVSVNCRVLLFIYLNVQFYEFDTCVHSMLLSVEVVGCNFGLKGARFEVVAIRFCETIIEPKPDPSFISSESTAVCMVEVPNHYVLSESAVGSNFNWQFKPTDPRLRL